MSYANKLLWSFIFGVILSLLWAAYIIALDRHYTTLALTAEFLIPWCPFVATAWWVDETRWSHRAWLTFTGALGAVVGTAIAMCF